MVTYFNWDMGWDIRRHDRLRAWSRVVTAGCGLIFNRNWGSRNSHLMDREAARGRRRRLNFFRSIVTFSRGWRPEFALRRPLEFPTVPSEGDFHVGREFLPLAFLREVRRGRRRQPRYRD